MAGFSQQIAHDGPEPDSVSTGLPDWMSEELVSDTRRVWSNVYGRVISEDEAIGILRNVRRFAEALMQAKEEEKS